MLLVLLMFGSYIVNFEMVCMNLWHFLTALDINQLLFRQSKICNSIKTSFSFSLSDFFVSCKMNKRDDFSNKASIIWRTEAITTWEYQLFKKTKVVEFTRNPLKASQFECYTNYKLWFTTLLGIESELINLKSTHVRLFECKQWVPNISRRENSWFTIWKLKYLI